MSHCESLGVQCVDSIHVYCTFLRILTLFVEVGNFISLSTFLTEKKRWRGLKQSTMRILLDSALLGWFSAYLRNLTRAQVSAFAHQEMVSVPQSRLTDLPRTETFLSLPFPPPLLPSISHPKGSLSPRGFPGNPGMLGCPWRMAAHQRSCSRSPVARLSWGGRRQEGSVGSAMAGFPVQGLLVCAFFLCSTRAWRGPAGPSKGLA